MPALRAKPDRRDAPVRQRLHGHARRRNAGPLCPQCPVVRAGMRQPIVLGWATGGRPDRRACARTGVARYVPHVPSWPWKRSAGYHLAVLQGSPKQCVDGPARWYWLRWCVPASALLRRSVASHVIHPLKAGRRRPVCRLPTVASEGRRHLHRHRHARSSNPSRRRVLRRPTFCLRWHRFPQRRLSQRPWRLQRVLTMSRRCRQPLPRPLRHSRLRHPPPRRRWRRRSSRCKRRHRRVAR